MSREPWTAPYSLRERLLVWSDWRRYRWGRFWTETVPLAIARKLPRIVRKWVVIDVASRSWSEQNLSPDQITYDVMYRTVERT